MGNDEEVGDDEEVGKKCRLFAGLLLSAFVLGSCLERLEPH